MRTNLSMSGFLTPLNLSSVFIHGVITLPISLPTPLIQTSLQILQESSHSQHLSYFPCLLLLETFMLSVCPMRENCMFGEVVLKASLD